MKLRFALIPLLSVALSACIPFYTDSKPFGYNAKHNVTVMSGVVLSMREVDMWTTHEDGEPELIKAKEFSVNQENGQIIKLVQPNEENFAVGDKVKVVRSDTIRITHKDLFPHNVEYSGYTPERDDVW